MEYEVGENESVSTAVVYAVSAVDGRDPASLPVLSEAVDPDALDRLFAPTFTDEQRPGGVFRFVYDHCFVTVESGEYITVDPIRDHPDHSNGADGNAEGR